ncbi:hypothetical protein NBRC116602_26880 [Hyphomicrobiales bacterium 4NK60-0047b]
MIKNVFLFVTNVFAIFCIVALTACKPSLDTVAATDDPKKLRTIAQTEDVPIDVQRAAIKKLGKIGATKQLEEMVRYPGGHDHDFRNKVLQVLGNTKGYISDSRNQEVLALIATTSNNRSDRLIAFKRIEDPLKLLLLAEHPLLKPEATHLSAIFETKEMQSKLYLIADYARFHHKNKRRIRQLAVKRLTDISVVQRLLTSGRVKLAKPSLDSVVRQKFAEMLYQISDEKILTKYIVRNYYRGTIDQVLLKKIEQGVIKSKYKLLEIALRSRAPQFVRAAIAKINDEELLTKISIDTKNVDAADKVRTPNLLAKIAKNTRSENVRLKTVKRITDQNVLADIALSDQSSHVSIAAAERISNPEILAKITVSKSSYKVSMLALKKIKDKETLLKIALETNSVSVIKEIQNRLQDPKLPLHIAQNTQSYDVALHFVKQTNDPNILADFLTNAKSMKARFEAADKFLILKYGKIKGALRKIYGGHKPTGVLLQLIILDQRIKSHYGDLTMMITQRFDEPKRYGRHGEYFLDVEHVTIAIKNFKEETIVQQVFSGNTAKGAEKFLTHSSGGSNTHFAEINTMVMCLKLLEPLPDQVRSEFLKLTSNKYNVGKGCSTVRKRQ